MVDINLAGAMEWHKMRYFLLCEDGKVVEINKERLICYQEID